MTTLIPSKLMLHKPPPAMPTLTGLPSNLKYLSNSFCVCLRSSIAGTIKITGLTPRFSNILQEVIVLPAPVQRDNIPLCVLRAKVAAFS